MSLNIKPEQIKGYLKGEAGVPKSIVLEGLIEDSDSPGHVLFSNDRCMNWVMLNVLTIDTLEILGRKPCDGHSHTYARIKLKFPESEEAKHYADLLSSMALESQRSDCTVIISSTCHDGQQVQADGYGSNPNEATRDARRRIKLACALRGGVKSEDGIQVVDC